MRRVALAVLVFAACASPAAPPGGPPDTEPPQLLRVTPDSGQVQVKPKNVVFQFDEVVSELPRGGNDLSRAVLVSPSDGVPVVDWHRTSITVHPRHGWKANTTYVVTLLPGVQDLRNNVRDSTTVVVFSTGDNIPQTRLTGAVFDWAKAAVVAHAYVYARTAEDTTLIFATEADSVGRFVLPFLTPATYQVRAVVDGNKNRLLDPREPWDSATVTLRDTASVELYTFVHDTVGPRLTNATVDDSMTVRLTFDQPLSPVAGVLPQVEIFLPDSSPVAVAGIVPWTVLADRKAQAARARNDSIAAADTNTAARAARDRIRVDSTNRAAAIADSIARDTTRRVPPPVSKRPALVTEVGVQLSKPLVPGTRYRLRVSAKGILGAERITIRTFERPKPSPDSGAVRRTDTTATKPPPLRLSRSP